MSSTPGTAHSAPQRGFTLIELMVTLAIVVILGLLAAPSLQSLMAKIRMNGLSSQFTGNVLRARSEAVNRNVCTVMCMSSTTSTALTADGTGALTGGPSCGTTGVDWQAGWIVFLKADCSQAVDAANSMPARPEDYIAIQAATAGAAHLDAGGTTAVKKIFFDARGRPIYTDGAGTAAAAASFSLYYQNTTSATTLQYGQNICADLLGRTRTISRSVSC